jgi:hypothetical protein
MQAQTKTAQDAIPRLFDFLARSQSSFYAIVLFVTYVLCFVYMDSERYPNTEQLCIGMFLGLHIIFLLYFLLAAKNQPSAMSTARICLIDLPSAMRAYWSGTVSLAPIFIISWILMIAAMSLFVQMYMRLHARFTKDNRPVDLGGNGHVQQKESIKQMLITNTVLLWVLFYTIFGIFIDPTDPNKRIVGYPGACRRKPDNNLINSNGTKPVYTLEYIYKTGISTLMWVRPYAEWIGITSVSLTSLILSSLTVWKAQQLALDMGTITNPDG